ncbi:hypothetical protein [Hydrogenophaga sp. 2FB]|uniref:hypothetical protein n=1 Tax=Hydrogenophaga sp. 2FB TaxID=2502187 RepID=UPI0010F621BB|nr:hypothetical protein [Hydrogenophaga sp. 2FB]
MRSKQAFPQAVAQSAASRALYIDGAQRNTVRPLFVTLSFIAAGTTASLASQLSHPGLFITLLGLFGLWYASSRVTRSTWWHAATTADSSRGLYCTSTNRADE